MKSKKEPLKLFDDFIRAEMREERNGEPGFTYLNNSARPEIEQVRQMLEGWFSHYPLDRQMSFLKDFRCANPKVQQDAHHRGAFLELLTHQLLRCLGYDNVEVKPMLPPLTLKSKPRTPDFLVKDKFGNPLFYVEATIATGQSDEEAKWHKRENEIIEELNQMPSPDFSLHISTAIIPIFGVASLGTPTEFRRYPKTWSSVEDIKASLIQYLSQLSYDEVDEYSETHRPVKEWTFRHDVWSIMCWPYVKRGGNPGKGELFGFRSDGLPPRYLPSEPIRDAVLTKAEKYQDVLIPHIVVVNALGVAINPDDLYKSLFGETGIVISPDTSEPKIEVVQIPDGALTSGWKPTSHISGVLLMIGARPQSISAYWGDSCLFYNPAATHPLIAVFQDITKAVPYEGTIKLYKGRSLKEIIEQG